MNKTDDELADEYTILADKALRNPDISDELAFQIARVSTNTAKSLRGGNREGAGRKPLSSVGKQARTAMIGVKVEADILAFWRSLPIQQKRELLSPFLESLRQAYVESLIV